MERYGKVGLFWDDVFQKEEIKLPKEGESGNEVFDEGLRWLTENASSVMDFGCASGTLLLLCSQYGTAEHIGIDLSAAAVAKARKKGALMHRGRFSFFCGGVETLKDMETASMDAAILSNIIDNLYPEDAHCVLKEVQRILRPDGRLLVKLNDFLTDGQILDYGIRKIQDHLLDDGLLLWNNSTEEWDEILQSYFIIERFRKIYYEEHGQYNRLYHLIQG